MKPLTLFMTFCTMGLCTNAAAQDTNMRPKKPQLDDTARQPKDTMRPTPDKKYQKEKTSLGIWHQYISLNNRNKVATKEEMLISI